MEKGKPEEENLVETSAGRGSRRKSQGGGGGKKRLRFHKEGDHQQLVVNDNPILTAAKSDACHFCIRAEHKPMICVYFVN